jgi:alkylation response protein AidB-like acyl-CoA dehydrogenase
MTEEIIGGSGAVASTTEGGTGFTVPEPLARIVDEVRAYVDEDVLPVERDMGPMEALDISGDLVQGLRARARERGIFAPQLPAEYGGLGLSAFALALVAQECGVSMLASIGLNAMAPDEGNMHVLLHATDEAQAERWLRPLAEGRIRSCFLMTEPDVASSDPLNLETTAVRDGDGWVIDGRKSFATGAIGAAFGIVVARTGPRELGPRAYSLIVVPTDVEGWTVLDDPHTIGAHFPGGHPTIALNGVRVPSENLLGKEGEGYRLAQTRLATGRLGHAMRWIGISQRALDLAAERMLARESFGARLADHQMLQAFVADSAIELYASRLMVLHAAWKVDQGLEHRQEIAMLKTFVSEAFGRILDRALQVFGAAGMTHDHPIAQWFADARAARIYDGASEVHRMSIARKLLRLAEAGESTRAGCGGL